uniref:Uncharacterized protein n=1 Tax=Rhizophora mucronata TaxID=61149 RepID=A0A2P2QN65_RHIMU
MTKGNVKWALNMPLRDHFVVCCRKIQISEN